MTAEAPGRWWHLELAAEFPSLEIYSGGWGPEQELALIELGDRVLEEEAFWIFTRLYSKEHDRVWAAVTGMFRMVVERIRRDRRDHPEDEHLLRVLAGRDPDEVPLEEIPPGWLPDTQAWDEGRLP